MRTCASSGLLVDWYQLTMAQAYLAQEMNETAVFEFFVRKLPAKRNFLIAAGLDQALEFLESFAFSADEIAWLSKTGRLDDAVLKYLRNVRFTGGVDAMPEGSVFFANEPILRVTAPLIEAQLVETGLINVLNFQSAIASKAIRCVLAAKGKPLTDFGFRRSHGAEAGILSARASYLAGFASTSNVLAARLFDIPLSGTMAHSFVQANASETAAFEGFARANPNNATLLIDTYDIEAAAKTLPKLAEQLQNDGIAIQAVRLDSGDLAAHAHEVRAILDAGGLRNVKIFASGGLDEYAIDQLLSRGAPIDGFGVGTRMNTSADHPYLDCAYKLQEYAGIPRRKKSERKETWPGRKQVFREFDRAGKMIGDTLTLDSARSPGVPLLDPVMRDGKRLQPKTPLSALRERTFQQIESLPPSLLSIEQAETPYPVTISDELRALAETLDQHGALTHVLA